MENNNKSPVIYWRCLSSGPFSVRYESMYFRELNKDTLYCNVDLYRYADKVQWLGDDTPEDFGAYPTKSKALEEFKKKTLKMLEEEESRINAPVLYWRCHYCVDSYKPEFHSVYFYELNKHHSSRDVWTLCDIWTDASVKDPKFADCFPTKREAFNHYKEKVQKDILELEKEIVSEKE